MKTLHIAVNNKIATYLKRDGHIVCGNNDYSIAFTFDTEWDSISQKTARFIWNGRYQDVEFTGTTCTVPIITNATEVTVGVYAGDLKTTTPAKIPCEKSIRCGTTISQDDITTDSGSSGGSSGSSGSSGSGDSSAAASAAASASRAQASATAAANSATQAQASATAAQNAQTAIASMLNEYITEIDTLIGG